MAAPMLAAAGKHAAQLKLPTIAAITQALSTDLVVMDTR